MIVNQLHRRRLFTGCLLFIACLLLTWIHRISPPLQAQTDDPIMQRLSHAPDGTPGNAYSQNAVISADGSTVAFVSAASNLVISDTNQVADVFVRDMAGGVISRVSIASNGAEGNAVSGNLTAPALSADGRYVAFSSLASNLVDGDTNFQFDVFVHDRQTGQTVRVSVGPDGSQGDWGSSRPAISGDGRYVAFTTRSAFSATDTNGFSDVYVHDRDVDGDGVFDEPGAIATIRVSVTSNGGQANSYVEDNRIDISADGRHVAFVSFASNLVSGDTNGIKDIFVHDRDTDTDGVFDEVGAVRTVRVSAGADGAEANGVSYDPSFSGDGRYVAFWSVASNLVPGDTVQCAGSTCQDVFVFDRDAGGDGVFDEADDVAIVMASTSTSGQPGDLPSYSPRMAANGRYVTFYSLARNLLGADTVWLNIFVKDLETGAVIHASISENGEQANGNSGLPDISADGNLVVFESNAANLIAGAPSTQSNIYLFNRQGDLPTPTPTVTPTNTPTATSTPTSIPVATPTAQPGAPAWQSTLLDVRGFVGQNADIVLDAAGRPHIAYNSDNIGRGELRYAWWDGFVWHSEVVDTAPGTGEYPSIALTTNGRPRISYFHRDTTALKYAARGDDGTWQTYTVDGSGAGNDRGRFSALTLDPTSGLADIIYYDATAGRLLHVRGAPGLWTYYVVDESSDVGANASLARGPNGVLSAVYYDRSNRWTRYAQWDPSTRTWAAIDFDVSGETGHRTALAYDSRGRLHVAYLSTFDNQVYSLRYALRSGQEWAFQNVASNVTVEDFDLTVDALDQPVIGFRQGSVNVARRNEGGWRLEVVDVTVLSGASLAIAYDTINDRAHLVYQEGRYDDLAYAVWAPAWQERVVGVGDDPSLVVRNGRPQIVYHKDDAPSSLAHASGNPGPSWGESLIRAGAGASSNPAVLDAGGVLHTAFYQSTTRTIFYAMLVNGAWNFEAAATLPEGAIFQPNLRLVFSGGEPRVIYTFYTGEVLLNIAYRSNGVWQTSTHPSPRALGTEPNFDALALDSGALAISYWDAGDSDLRLVTWSNDAWVDTLIEAGLDGAEVGELNAIARGYDVVDGETVFEVLAVAYYDRSNQSIRYAYNRPGIGWQTTQLVPNVGLVSGLDLAVAGDTHALPYIVFTTQDFVNTNGDLRLAFSDDNLQTVTLETIAEDAALYGARPSLVHDNQARIVYRNVDGEIVYTFPTARRAVPAPVHNDGLTGAGRVYGAGLDLVVCLYFFVLPRSARTTLVDALATTVLPDGQVMGQMTERFRQSIQGQRYVGLAAQHAQEMADIARGDPSLLWDGHRVMQNFMPGLEAWVSGQGDEVIVTQQMADDALDIWQRIAAQGGPELSAAINAELAATNNLQDFVGDSFDQWAAEIGVESGAQETIFLPRVQR